MGEAAALIAAFTWSCTSVALTSLGTRVAPAVLSALRLVFGSIVLAAVVLISGEASDYGDATAENYVGLIGSGLLGYAIGDTLYIQALKQLGMQRTFPVTMALFIVLSVAGGVVLLDEPFSWGLAVGSTAIGAGIYLIVMTRSRAVAVAPDAGAVVQPTAVQPVRQWHRGAFSGGYWLLVAVGITWAAASLLLASTRGDLGAIAAGTLRTPAGAVGLLCFTAATQRPMLAVPFRDRRIILGIAAAGIIGTGFGSLLYVYSVVEIGIARAVLLNATAPLMSIPLAFFFLRERLTRRIIAGTVFCVAGIILVVA